VIKREIYLALLLLIFAPLSRGGGEESLTPFKIWQQSRGEWEKDPTEVAYVVFRCGTIFDVIGRVFIENGATLEHKANGNRMVERATALLSTGSFLSLNTGMSETRILERAKSFFEIYHRLIVENRRLHNDMFNGQVGQDFDFCVNRYALMAELGKRISGQEK
jgi:hypothetical protein